MSTLREPRGLAGLGAACLAGVLVVVLAIVLAKLVSAPSSGHHINTTALPAEAQAILAQQPGVPITAEQWRRLDSVMATHGGWPSGGSILAASIRQGWYWFVLLPALAVVGFQRSRWRGSSITFVLVALPSLAALALSLFASRGSLA